MDLIKQNVLFVLRAPQHGGTENVVLQLCEIFKPLVNKIVVASADGFEIDKLNSLGITHYVIPDIEDKTAKNIFRVCKALKRIVTTEHITVIHTHHRMAAFYVRMLGLYRQCVFINTSHNTFTNKRVLTYVALNKANLIACGEMVKSNLQNVFGLKNVTVIHNAAKAFSDKIVADPTIEQAKRQGKFLIGNIGRLSKQKGMEYYIRAIPLVIAEHPEVHFFIIGSGEDEEKLKKMSQGLPLSFLGYRGDIQNLMSQLDLVVLSSLWEGLPLTPIEAFSVGKTIVATDVDGTPEIVCNGKNGLLVKAKDTDELADAIIWMIEHPEEKVLMEERAEATYKSEFSIETLSNAYVDYYRRL